MKPSDGLLVDAAAQRETLTTVVGTVHVWHDRARAVKVWQGWVASRPPGSVTTLTPHGRARPRPRFLDRIWDRVRSPSAGMTNGSGAATPFDQTPPSVTSRLWLERPARWRVETTADEGEATGVLVIDGEHWDFGLVSRDDEGVERKESDNSSPLALHASVAGMIDVDDIVAKLDLEPAGTVVHAERNCYRLIGTLTDPDDFPVWPGDSYDLLLDSLMGILLRFEARSGGAPHAKAEFTEVVSGGKIPADAFAFGTSPMVLSCLGQRRRAGRASPPPPRTR